MSNRLTRNDLNKIQAGNRRNPDVKTLLAEIRALRSTLNNAWQALDTLPPPEVNSRLDQLIKLINNELCVVEQRADYEQTGRGKIALNAAGDNHVRTHQPKK